MKKINKKGFTLIELLVVITIIGILATGWVSIFTKQLQWARDTNRMNNIKILESAAHQYYSDNSVFPDSNDFLSWTQNYVSKEIKDPKPGSKICSWSWVNNTPSSENCWWFYWVDSDSNSLEKARFKLATNFEKKENFWDKWPAQKDGWTIKWYYEVFWWEWWSWTTISNIY